LDDLGNAEAERIQRVNQYPDIDPTPENAQAFIQAREEQITDYLIDKYEGRREIALPKFLWIFHRNQAEKTG